MPRTRTSQIDEVALLTACPYCGAQPDVWCRTKSGRWYEYLHSTRVQPVQRLASTNYAEGHLDGFESALSHVRGGWAPRPATVAAVEEWLADRVAAWTGIVAQNDEDRG